MNTRHLVDPQMIAFVDAFPPIVLNQETLPQVRVMGPRLFPPAAAQDDLVIRERHVPGPDGAPDVRVIVTSPAGRTGASLPALVWIHGGGMVSGAAEQSQALINEFAGELGCPVVSVDYRLAPETRHPAPGTAGGLLRRPAMAVRRRRRTRRRPGPHRGRR
ncbi:hypothetical protein GCM10023194_37960 [Planotetraspora phitsanulokensis]|uniref:Alpha/beta hydrolase fold-3 domain-containing protein n=1 Tax=Planotetraspora phitsanulokensis TaxID=575192 RepID=A0A8J3XIS5_9ACTN|nr:alpha/beta hydrolase [Planotetraspora phitsanulokensis]GII41241.1 hypothetical protein Pph01_62440 [Planotetraspora phitsanulokensis]